MQKIFTVYDAKAEFYMNPFFAKSTGEALRQFTDVANNKETQIGKHPTDYTLFELGQYDENNGTLSLNETKIPLGVAHEFIKSH